MKAGRRSVALALSLMFMLTLCSCNPGTKLPGTWKGDGGFDILAVTAPFEFAQELTFRDDGTVTAVVGGETREFTYSWTDDTLTLSDGEISWGILYQVGRDTLTFTTGGGTSAAFTKVK